MGAYINKETPKKEEDCQNQIHNKDSTDDRLTEKINVCKLVGIKRKIFINLKMILRII
jgi:hypothetical protein